jgi:hypothetical protein
LGPQNILLAVTLKFRADLKSEALQGSAAALAARARATEPRIRDVFLRFDGEPLGGELSGRNAVNAPDPTGQVALISEAGGLPIRTGMSNWRKSGSRYTSDAVL